MGSQNWRKLPIHVNDVSEGGLGAEISKEQMDDLSAAKDAGECVLHTGLSVMMAFGAEGGGPVQRVGAEAAASAAAVVAA